MECHNHLKTSDTECAMIRQLDDSNYNPVQMETVTDPAEIARANAQHEQFDRNWEWFQKNLQEIYAKHRGQHICIAEQELFVGKSAKEAWQASIVAHPNDDGRFLKYIHPNRNLRIYANQR